MLSYKTKSVNKKSAEKKWILIDAENQALGRVSSKIAKILRGKHKPNFTPHDDCGDFVVVINASKINLSGNKWEAKEYLTYSGYPGGQKKTSATDLMAKNPIAMVEKSVRGMLPKNRLGRALFNNMFVYAEGEHNQEAQKPEAINLERI